MTVYGLPSYIYVVNEKILERSGSVTRDAPSSYRGVAGSLPVTLYWVGLEVLF